MGKATLKQYYERQYSSESHATSIVPIDLVQIPTSRWEAAVKFFPKYFKGGDVLEIGAGNGNVAKTLLNSDTRINSYTLGDLSLPRVEGLSRNLGDSRVKVFEMDAEDIPDKAVRWIAWM